MGIDVRLKRETGEVLGEVGDPQLALSRAKSGLLQDTRLLRYLVPWGDAVFNQAQAADLKGDVHARLRVHRGSALGDVLTKMEPLIDRLSTETHAYLWFIGD
jgi:hypothetical protein